MDRSFPLESATLTEAPCATARTARRAERDAHAVFEHAIARSGRAEHEWLNPDVDSGSAFESGNGRVLVLPNRCMASSDGRALELQLEIAAGSTSASHTFAVRYVAEGGAAEAGSVIGSVQYALDYF